MLTETDKMEFFDFPIRMELISPVDRDTFYKKNIASVHHPEILHVKRRTDVLLLIVMSV